MRSSAKRKRVGRSRESQRRPILAARVTEEFRARIIASAAISGRNVSEELIWRAEQSYEWEKAHGTAQAMLAGVRRATEAAKKLSLNQTLSERGYTEFKVLGGSAWFEPGVPAPRWIFAPNAESRSVLQEMFDQAAMRAIEKMKETQS